MKTMSTLNPNPVPTCGKDQNRIATGKTLEIIITLQ